MERDKESGDRHVSLLPLSCRRQQWVCVIAQFPVAILCKSWMIFLHHVIRPRLIISEYHATTEITLMLCYNSLTCNVRTSQSQLQTIILNKMTKCCWACLNVGELTRVILICIQLVELRSVRVRHTLSAIITFSSLLKQPGEQVCLCDTFELL